jgi:hypothetical protein
MFFEAKQVQLNENAQKTINCVTRKVNITKVRTNQINE